MHRTAIIAALTLLLLPGCGRFSLPRGAASGPWFSTRICGVQVDNKAKLARLHIQLDVVKPLPHGALVETEFRNPADRSVLAASRTATGDERSIEITSPPFDQVRARNYQTVTRVYASADRKQVLGTHDYVCESLVDQRELGPQFQ
jgi:hypothetical protein